MSVYRLELSYDGGGFRGFARQPTVRTVQGELESALARILDAEVTTTGAGRTDAGVHARSQVVSFRCDGELDLGRMQRSLNGLLAPEIAIKAVTAMPESFDARFSAIWRTYHYQIVNSPEPDPLRRTTTWQVADRLDVSAMNQATAFVVGERDFSSFCRRVKGSSSVRRVLEASWLSEDSLLVFSIRATAFCHQMVRSIVGLLVDVGRGRRRPEEVRDVLEAGDRAKAGQLAPPRGLVLWAVGYGDQFQEPCGGGIRH